MRFRDDLQRLLYYHGQIDYSYWRIQEISNHNGKMETPLIAMIDKATGFDKVKTKERIKEVIYLTKLIIRCKKKLNYDSVNDAKFLIELKSI